MIHRVVVAALVVLLAPWAWGGSLTFTFIGNQAFHISDGETTLLSDFPYRSGAFGYMAYDTKDVPPIVDGLSLITHSHADHWSKKLFEESAHKVIAPEGITKRIEPGRVVPFSKTEPMPFKSMSVQAIEMPHVMAPEHFSYLVTWHGLRLYFPGDTETPADMLKQKDIDVMFITPWLIRTIARQDLTLDAKLLVVYHQKIDETFPPFQNTRRMKQGETFTVEFADD